MNRLTDEQVAMIDLHMKRLVRGGLGRRRGMPVLNGRLTRIWGATTVVRFMRETVDRLQLPVLRRKWDRIDVNLVSRLEVAAEHERTISELVASGMMQSDIVRATGLSCATVSETVKRLGLPYVSRRGRRRGVAVEQVRSVLPLNE
jgi:hypothetical protein